VTQLLVWLAHMPISFVDKPIEHYIGKGGFCYSANKPIELTRQPALCFWAHRLVIATHSVAAT
jgi:hypothetical protein